MAALWYYIVYCITLLRKEVLGCATFLPIDRVARQIYRAEIPRGSVHHARMHAHPHATGVPPTTVVQPFFPAGQLRTPGFRGVGLQHTSDA